MSGKVRLMWKKNKTEWTAAQVGEVASLFCLRQSKESPCAAHSRCEASMNLGKPLGLAG